VVSDATYEPNSPLLKIFTARVDCKSTDEVLADLPRTGKVFIV